ncbi:MAG: TIGR01777 family protein [Flavobacteriales bacterium]|nr:TIGR01777 family protein [Flavobacteriales bacterium]
METKKIVIAGANGFLGRLLVQYYNQKNWEVHTLTRKPVNFGKGIHNWVWDGQKIGHWKRCLDGALVLVNLAGKSVDCRYTEKNKTAIVDSRVKSTLALGGACIIANRPPAVWINASSATIYAHNENQPFDESGQLGEGFSVEVCKQWEKTFEDIPLPTTRKVALRLAMVLGKEGGVLPTLKRLVRLGLGGTMGMGNQMISWIHEEDFLRAVDYAIENPIRGNLNISAPNPIKNKEFMAQLRDGMEQKIGIRAHEWLLEIGAMLMRTETELILKSRNVVPGRLLNHGFKFKYQKAPEAINELLT